MHVETEFYALNVLKIPVKPNSALGEMLDEEEVDYAENARESLLGARSLSSCSDIESDVDMHVGIISINQILREKKTRKEAKRFLENMQKDLCEMREKTKTYKDSLDEATATLTDVRFRSIDRSQDRDEKGTIRFIVILAVVILVVFPIFLYLYIIYPKNNTQNDHDND